MREKLYTSSITDRDRFTTRITLEKGQVQHYSFQYDCRFGDTDEWAQVRRYDCSHNVVHVHFFNRDGSERRKEYPDESFRDGLNRAQQELRDDWQRFRQEYELGAQAE